MLNNSQLEPLNPRELLDANSEYSIKNLNIYDNIQSISDISTRNLILQLWLDFEKLKNYLNRFKVYKTINCIYNQSLLFYILLFKEQRGNTLLGLKMYRN